MPPRWPARLVRVLKGERRPLVSNGCGRRFSTTILASIVTILVLLTAGAPAESTGTVTRVATRGQLLHPRGSVEILRAGATAWGVVATTNAALQPGDTVRTGRGSRALVQLSGGPLDGSVIRLDEHTRLRLEPRAGEGGFLVKLFRGAAYFFHRERAVRTEFDTPLVSGAIRGTEFQLRVGDDGATTVTVLDGAVTLRTGDSELALGSSEEAVFAPGQTPRKTAMLEAKSVIQWCLYYPAVIVPEELPLTDAERDALRESLVAYTEGDLNAALEKHPAARADQSDAEKIYLAALLMAHGQVTQGELLLADTSPVVADLAGALRTLGSVARGGEGTNVASGGSASAELAASYAAQGALDLRGALARARAARQKAPGSGFARAREAELEFGFGRVGAARTAAELALELAPRHAPAQALLGFIHAAEGRNDAARAAFERAIELDPAFADGWLGRGLVRIRSGDGAGGREDLMIAAAVEPGRAVLRSYLGKAFSGAGDSRRALAELDLAKDMDARDPTAWLYEALVLRQANRVNEAVRALEQSQALNDNRQVHRSRLLLDEDRAVRSANLANVYRDTGMEDVSVREAGRAVAADYGNYSAHLFLAESYNALRDPNLVNLRYETVTLSELLLANLLSPAGAGAFSGYVTAQEYSRLFERDGMGFVSDTLYLSRGDWSQDASAYGTYGRVSFAVDVGYRSYAGQQPNGDLEQTVLSGTVKLQFTPRDTLLLLPVHATAEGGDVRQHYDPASANRSFRFSEDQQPNFFAGWRHEWQPGLDTLVLAGWLNDDVNAQDGEARILTVTKTNGVPASVSPPFFGFRDFAVDQDSDFTAWSAELQQIWQLPRLTMVGGSRFQQGQTESAVALTKLPAALATYPTAQGVETDLERVSVYGYAHWRVAEPLWLIGGVAYDRLEFPENGTLAPLSDGQESKDRVSPKAGLVWTPSERFAARGAWTRSLGGLFYDNSVRLEPTQIAGFNQAYRSLIPESVAGTVPGTEFETWGAELEYRFPTATYLALRGEVLESDGERTIGVFDIDAADAGVAVASGTRETLKFREQALAVTLNQLVGKEWSFGASYRVSEAELDEHLPELTAVYAQAANDLRGTLQQAGFFAGYAHAAGFFAQAQAQWLHQRNEGYTPGFAGEDFWQLHLWGGWRFARRRAEVTVGVLNLADQDYRLNPLNYHLDLPRERTFMARLKVNF